MGFVPELDLSACCRVHVLGHGAFLFCPLFDAFGGRVPTRTLDFVHAVGYLHKLPEALSKPGELGTDYKKGILKKWGDASLMKNLAKTFGGN